MLWAYRDRCDHPPTRLRDAFAGFLLDFIHTVWVGRRKRDVLEAAGEAIDQRGVALDRLAFGSLAPGREVGDRAVVGIEVLTIQQLGADANDGFYPDLTGAVDAPRWNAQSLDLVSFSSSLSKAPTRSPAPGSSEATISQTRRSRRGSNRESACRASRPSVATGFRARAHAKARRRAWRPRRESPSCAEPRSGSSGRPRRRPYLPGCM